MQSGQSNAMRGYLSLHAMPNDSLRIRWTPNELMGGGHSDPKPRVASHSSPNWRFSIDINVDDIIYLHYHHQPPEAGHGGSIVLVGADGVQHAPIVFPIGQHPLHFLSCLESGLLPHAQLDPPLWMQRGKGRLRVLYCPSHRQRCRKSVPPPPSKNIRQQQ